MGQLRPRETFAWQPWLKPQRMSSLCGASREGPSTLPVLASSLSWSLVPGVHASLPHRRLPATGWELSVSGICRTPSLYLFSSVGLGLSLRVGAMLSVWCPALCSGHPPCTTSSSISHCTFIFSPCCPRHYQWSGRTMTPSCGQPPHFPCKTPGLLRTRDDRDRVSPVSPRVVSSLVPVAAMSLCMSTPGYSKLPASCVCLYLSSASF